MTNFSRALLAILNVIILITAVTQIVKGESLKHLTGEQRCLHDNASSMVWTGMIILITSIIGIVACLCEIKALEFIYLWVVLISTFAAFTFTAFIIATMPGYTAFEAFDHISKNGYWINEYNPALVKALTNERDWYALKSCYIQTNICDVMRNQSRDEKPYYLEIGCCLPPNRCGLVQKNGSTWGATPTGITSNDEECRMWARLEKDCFDCESCKAGYVATYHDQWDANFGMTVSRVLFLMSLSIIAWFTFDDHQLSKNRNNDHHPQRLPHTTMIP